MSRFDVDYSFRIICYTRRHNGRCGHFSLCQLSALANIYSILALFVSAGDCGLRNVSSGKIVGGRPAKQCEFPWQVSLQVNGYHFCGGSIISPDTVVTAAHCLSGRINPVMLDVVAGNVDLKKRSAHYQQRRVKSSARHENFGKRGMRDDIALLRLEQPFDFDGSGGCVTAVCLPDAGRKIRDAVVVSGWGTTREGGRISSELLAVSVRVTSDAYCALQYVQPGTLASAYDKETMFCAGELLGGKDSCQGDSGGPAIQFQNGTSVLVGIVSFGRGCARLTHAGVYTRVPNYTDWIQEHAKEL
nr:trypsin-1-like [Dermacentor andersoni]